MASTIPLFGPPQAAPWDADSLAFMQADLARSGLIPEDMGTYPISSKKYDEPAYVIPYNGNSGLYRIRIARERDKYIGPSKVTPDLWLPPNTDIADMYDGDLYIVEGEKKAAAVYKYWQLQNVVGVGGCWNSVQKIEGTETYRLIERLQLLITPGRQVHVILDGDVIENKNVGRAALALQQCIAQLNGVMLLYRPPSEWKGVDDWIYQDPKACAEHLELVDYSRLAINRTLLYSQLGCSLNQEGQLILNDLNALKLLNYHFASQGIAKDKRLGFIGDAGTPINSGALATAALQFMQGDISPRYGASAINGAFGHYISSDSNQTDLVRDLVKNRLAWDGVDRLETWGSEYFETTFPKLANEWGRILFTSLVLRILEPGCKIDIVPILNGPQGIGKTTFFEELARIDKHSFYKSITELPGSTGDDRTFKQTLAASLIVDLGEGVIFESRKTSSDRLKQFLTERFDEYRVAYAKNNTIAPRGYMFVGTTNRADQLTDYTGSRRFLYLNVSKIKRMDYGVKLQLMAEVAAKYNEIVRTPWYDLRLTLEDMPQIVREENAHITSVAELLNVEHYRADALTEQIRIMLDNQDYSTLKATSEPVITASFIVSRLGQAGNIQITNMVSRKFIELSSSPQFPFTFEKTRKRGAQVDFKQGHKDLYTSHITNDQVMFTCFVIKRK